MRDAPVSPAIDGFVDALLQKFENCRSGLSDEALSAGGAERFFLDLYEPERARLREILRRQQPHLEEAAGEALLARVEELLSSVVLPGYVRLAAPFIARERNGFFLAREPLHAAERVGWAAAGTLLGAFVVWAPFIPLWSKEWVLPFFLGGLVFPELRRWFELTRYERELNRVVRRADAEIGRIEMNFLMGEGRAAADPPPRGRRRSRAEQPQGDPAG